MLAVTLTRPRHISVEHLSSLDFPDPFSGLSTTKYGVACAALNAHVWSTNSAAVR